MNLNTHLIQTVKRNCVQNNTPLQSHDSIEKGIF